MDNNRPTNELVQYLPTPFREDQQTYLENPHDPKSIRSYSPTNDFLLAFEKILLGRKDGNINQDGLEQIVARIAEHFDPLLAPKEFLHWLAGWLAFSLRADLEEEKHRAFIQTLVPRYRYRGTKKSLVELFEVFTNRRPTIVEAEDQPHYFRVTVDFSDLIIGGEQQQRKLDRLWEIAYALIEREKPAHTYFTLIPLFPSFRVGRLDPPTEFYTQVGGIDAHGNLVGNTRLGTAYWES